MTTWDQSVPIEPIRFAGANHLCIDLTYEGSTNRIQPYALRRTVAGDLILHARRLDTGEHRSYWVDRMQRVQVTSEPFRPVHEIELSPTGAP